MSKLEANWNILRKISKSRVLRKCQQAKVRNKQKITRATLVLEVFFLKTIELLTLCGFANIFTINMTCENRPGKITKISKNLKKTSNFEISQTRLLLWSGV